MTRRRRRPRPPRAIVQSAGDPWHGCDVQILATDTAQLVRCKLRPTQLRFAQGQKHKTRTFRLSDLI